MINIYHNSFASMRRNLFSALHYLPPFSFPAHGTPAPHPPLPFTVLPLPPSFPSCSLVSPLPLTGRPFLFDVFSPPQSDGRR